jgi:ribose transport system ATP-binding protein
MLGKQFDSHAVRQFEEIDRGGVPLLAVSGLEAPRVENVSFRLWPGEILGIAGLLGSGRTEILHAITGISTKYNGDIRINGETAKIGSTKDSIEMGISLIPEDRRTQGLITDFPIGENIVLPILRRLKRIFLINDKRGRRIATDFIQRFNIKAKDAKQEARFLSGGNQQKVVVAKGMVSESKVLLLDDPTFGIDVQSKKEIMDIVRDFVSRGNGAIFISSELEEIAEICDRILVIKKGTVTKEIDNSKVGGVTEEDLLRIIQ